MANVKDLTGQRFGELVVIEATNRRSNKGSVMWHCVCSCGQHTLVNSDNLTKTRIRSCGHGKAEIATHNLIGGRKATHKEGTDLGQISSQKPRSNNKSGVRGVSWNKTKGKWLAELVLRGEQKLYKLFINKQDAINARKEAEKKYFKPIIEKYSENK